MISQITDALSNAEDYRIYWLNWIGPGKLAVARTIAEKLSKQGRLAASFLFFRGKPGRQIIKHFFPTIAYQLTISVPGLKGLVMKRPDNFS